MDKYRTKLLWAGLGLPTPPFHLVSPSVTEKELTALMLRFPVMVKPISEGSSIGMSKCDAITDLLACIELASQYDHEILLEAFILGEEYTVAIIDNKALPSIRLVTPSAFYDYNAKYASKDTQYHCPSSLSEKEEEAIRSLALKAFHSVGCVGWGRVDVMRDKKTNEFFLLEVNTVPGMTERSLVPLASQTAGISFEQLVLTLLAQTLPSS